MTWPAPTAPPLVSWMRRPCFYLRSRADRASGSGGPGLCAPCDGCRRGGRRSLAAYLSSAFKTAFDRAFAQAGDAGATNTGALMLRPEMPPRPFDIEALRAEFPALSQEVNGKPLVYMDSAASTLKPQAVIDAISHYYAHDHSNVHRGAHALADRATAAFEAARDSVARFLSGPGGLVRREEVIWTRGTTEAINLVAQSWGSANLCPGDEVLISEMEHHANIVPWQLACERTGATQRLSP